MKKIFLILAILSPPAFTQGVINSVSMESMLLLASEPATCLAGQYYFNTSTMTGRLCTATNTWGSFGTGGGGGSGLNGALTFSPTLITLAGSTLRNGYVPKIFGSNVTIIPGAGSLASSSVIWVSYDPIGQDYVTDYNVNVTVSNLTFSSGIIAGISATSWRPGMQPQFTCTGGATVDTFTNCTDVRGQWSSFPIAGTGITVTYDGNGNTVISATGGGGSSNWSALLAGTNTGNAFLIGAAGSLSFTGGGVINASQINGITVTGTPATGYVPTATSSTTATWQAQAGGGGTNVGRINTTATFSSPIPDGATADATFTWTGVTTGNTVVAAIVSPPAGFTYLAFVSASNTVDVRLVNLSGAAATPGALTVNAVLATYILTGTGTPTFSAINDGTCGTGTFTLTGASAGNPVAPQWPSTFAAGLSGSMIVSATNTIQVTICNQTGATVTPVYTLGASIAE